MLFTKKKYPINKIWTLLYKEKDYESLFTSLVSGSSLITTSLIELTTKNIALILMIWMGLMSLIKLKIVSNTILIFVILNVGNSIIITAKNINNKPTIKSIKIKLNI